MATDPPPRGRGHCIVRATDEGEDPNFVMLTMPQRNVCVFEDAPSSSPSPKRLPSRALPLDIGEPPPSFGHTVWGTHSRSARNASIAKAVLFPKPSSPSPNDHRPQAKEVQPGLSEW